ncbi:MAG: hypothetical protein M3303_01070 [Gemmatimonadota bacterium]|nr:hypothetical protein [Gemmatimonadota bacterium]
MRATWTAAALALAVAPAGCGGSNADEKPAAAATTATTATAERSAKAAKPRPSASVTRKAFVARADQACRDANTRRKQLERVGSTAIKLARLEAPPADEARVDRYVVALEVQLGLMRRLDDARRRKHAGEVSFLESALATARARTEKLAKGYGFEVCRAG